MHNKSAFGRFFFVDNAFESLYTDNVTKREREMTMKFQLFQIQLTNEEIDTINAAGDHGAVSKNKARINMQMDFSGSKTAFIASEAYSKGYYSHVANIEADDLDDVFEIGNIGPESAIERLSRMSSVSVGDLIIDEEGNKSVVASFGFEEVA